MQAPLNWHHPSTSAELRPMMAKLTGDTALLAFSTGKDALAAWLAIRPHFKRIVPVHYELIPGLDFIQRSLAYYEEFFDCKIIRRIHPSFVRWLKNCTFQSPEHWSIIEDADLPEYTHETIMDSVALELGLKDAFTAVGVRACDSPYRRMAVKKHGAVRWDRLAWWPVYDWNIADVDAALAESGVKLPIDYRLWGRTFDGIDHRFLAPMKQYLPGDYVKVLEWFPLADLELYRRELRP